MRTFNGWYLLIGLSLFAAGCGKCCGDVSTSESTSSSSSTSTDADGPACCEVEPSRAAFLAGSKTTETGECAEGTVKSGPQVGEEVPGPFHPMNVTGEQAGKKACLYCSNGGNPVAVVFARSVTPEVATLLKKLDEATARNDKVNMGSFAVFCSDKEGLENSLKDLAAKQGLKKLVLSIDNPAGPKSYEIAKDADVTVLLYNEFTVRSNHAFKTGELNQKGIDGVVAAVSKIVPAK